MKTRLFRLIIICAFFFLCTFSANGYDFMVDGIAYNINNDGNSVTVTYEKDTSHHYPNANGPITIPETVTHWGRTYTVTAIASYAFQGCSGFNGSLTLPNTIKTIGFYAFENCSGLTGSLTIPNSVTQIGNYAFKGCTGFTGSLTIGEAVTSIGVSAFFGCTGFTGSLTIPNSVISLGSFSFYECIGFNGSLTIGTSIKAIGISTFRYCRGFTSSLIIPESVTSIGNSAFEGCSGFTGSIIIPNSVTTIGTYAFSGCTGFTGSLTIPFSVKTIEHYAFSECSGLIGPLSIANGVETIRVGSFSGCNSLKSAYIPVSVKSIGNSAFSGCSGLTDIYTEIFNPLEVPLGETVFNHVNKETCLLHVPTGTVDDYRIAEQWRDFFNIVTPSGIIISLELNPNIAEMLEGDQVIITPIITPWYATEQTLVWASSDTTIATVDSLGVVTGVKEGFATISATTTDGSNITATCTVTVKPIAATSITIEPLSANITAGDTYEFSLSIAPENATYKTANWSSSDETIATVDENGIVTGVAAGQAQITATTIDGTNLSATSVITVLPRKASSISVAPDSVLLDIGGSLRLTATIEPDNTGSTVLLWQSSDEDVAIVTSKGMVFAIGAGQTLITATTTDGSNLSDTCHVTVQVPFELSAQDLAVPVNTLRNIPVSIDNHVAVKSFALTVNVPKSIDFVANAVAAPRCNDFNITTIYNTDSTIMHIEGFMSNQAMSAGSAPFVLLPIKSSKYIDTFVITLTDITFTSTNDGVGTQELDDITVTMRVLDLGDVNGDKLVDVSDVNTLINYMLGKTNDLTNFGVGDINNDGIIDVSDVNAVINLMLGKE